MSNLKKVVLGLIITFTMAIALVIGLVNMPKPSVDNANNPLNLLDKPVSEGGGYAIIKDDNVFNYSYDATQQAGEDSTKVYEYYFKNTTDAEMAVKMHELECEGLSFKYATSKTEQTNSSSLTFGNKLNVEPLSPKGQDGDDVYVFVEVTPTAQNVSYSCPIKWTFGYRQTITFKVNGVQQGNPTIGICNYTKVEESTLPDLNLTPQSDFFGWYLDEACTTPATFPLNLNSADFKIYTKVEEYPAGNITSSNWFELNEDGVSYSLKKGTGTLPANVIIPKTHNNLPVTGIKSGTGSSSGVFYGQRSTITSITIPSTITSVGGYAFYGCTKLSSVSFRGVSQLSSIGSSAFYNCTGLSSIRIPSSVTSIGNSVFSSCSKLTNITIPSGVTNIGNSVFNNCTSLTNLAVDSGNALYDSRNNCNAIIETASNKLLFGCKSTTIPNSVISIEESAFYNCKSLTSIKIPNSVTNIGSCAFYNCQALISITLSSAVTIINKETFYGCSSLPSITIPNGITSIGRNAFTGCSALTSITLPDSLTDIGWYVFNGCSSLTNITIPRGVATIHGSSFSNTNNLERIIVESGNAVYDSRNNCNAIIETETNTLIRGLKSTVIPNTVTSIGDYAFDDCKSLTSIKIPNSVTSIGNYAFFGCDSLTSITIPSGVTSIGNYTFHSCSSLTSIDIPDSVTSIGIQTFANCSSLTSIVIPSGVTSIGSRMFNECTSLTSITIPNTVTSIGYYAFEGCKALTSIVIPSSVTKIGYYAFSNCSKLESLVFQKGGTWYYGTEAQQEAMQGGTAFTIVAGESYVATFTYNKRASYWYTK